MSEITLTVETLRDMETLFIQFYSAGFDDEIRNYFNSCHCFTYLDQAKC